MHVSDGAAARAESVLESAVHVCRQFLTLVGGGLWLQAYAALVLVLGRVAGHDTKNLFNLMLSSSIGREEEDWLKLV